MKALTEKQRATRNMHPHAEARLAMWLWSNEYAHEQRGGSMDFWDSIGADRQKRCKDIIDDVMAAYKDAGRAGARP